MQTLSDQLIDAILGGDPIALQRLLQAGADPRSIDAMTGMSAVTTAATGDASVLGVLLRWDPELLSDLPATDNPLRTAVLHHNLPAVQTLLGLGLCPDRENPPDRNTSLHLAAELREHAILNCLLAAPCRRALAGCDSLCFSPLHYAVKVDDYQVAKLLLAAGSDPDVSDSEWFADTPMELAIDLGRTTLIELLLQHGADPDRRASNGETPRERSARLNQVFPG